MTNPPRGVETGKAGNSRHDLTRPGPLHTGVVGHGPMAGEQIWISTLAQEPAARGQMAETKEKRENFSSWARPIELGLAIATC